MKQIRKRLTYANVMSSIAVFFVLGGGAAIAAKNVLPKNSVGPKQLRKNAVTAAKLKRNAVTAAKLKRNAVTTAKIKNRAITGAKIKTSTLGSVPSARRSAFAEKAGFADQAGNAANFSRYFASGLKQANVGQSVELRKIGPFTLVGRCIDKGAGDVEAVTILTTSQPGSSMRSYEDTYYNANFNPGMETEVGEDVRDDKPTIGWGHAGSEYTGFWAASADGAYMIHGNAVNAILVFGSHCAFWLDTISFS